MANFENNIPTFTGKFSEDTGLDYKTNIDTYIQYVQARLLDQWMQQQNIQMNQLITEIKNRFHV